MPIHERQIRKGGVGDFTHMYRKDFTHLIFIYVHLFAYECEQKEQVKNTHNYFLQLFMRILRISWKSQFIRTPIII